MNSKPCCHWLNYAFVIMISWLTDNLLGFVTSIGLLCNFFSVNCWKTFLVLWLILVWFAIFFVNCWKTSLVCNLFRPILQFFSWIAEKPVYSCVKLASYAIFSWISEKHVRFYIWIWPVMQFLRELLKTIIFWFLCEPGLYAIYSSVDEKPFWVFMWIWQFFRELLKKLCCFYVN